MKQSKEIWICSNSAIDSLEYPKEIKVLRSTISFNSSTKVYEDYTDMNSGMFYQHLQNSPDDIPKTAYVSLGKIDLLLENAIQRGIEDIIVIVISSELSGLYKFFVNYAHFNHDKPTKIHPFDSQTVIYAESFMALTAFNMIQDGNSVDEVFKILNVIRDNNQLYFAVDTLKYLVLNGRLSKSSGMIGNFLKMKPLLHLSGGKVVPLEKARTSRIALKRLIEHYFENTINKNIITYISHADNLDESEKIKKTILDRYPNRTIIICPLSPVVGSHAGPRTVAIGTIDLDALSTVKPSYFSFIK